MNHSMKVNYINSQRVFTLANIGGWSANVASVLALTLAPFSNGLGIPLSFMALAGSFGANACFRSSTRTERLLDDHEEISDQAVQNAIYQELDPTPSVELEAKFAATNLSSKIKELPNFQWSSIGLDPVEYPHIALLTKTGGGKSTLAQYICSLFPGITYALDPHYESGSYSTANHIIGAGRNYGLSVEDESEVLTPDGSTTIAQFFGWLEREMNHRYQLGDNGMRVKYPPINIICDEFGSYASIKGISPIFKTILREGRKVGIRFIICVHGQQVKSLGLEGESDLRECLTFIRLGVFATEFAEMNIRNSKNGTLSRWEQVLGKLESFERPALVEELPAQIPNIKLPESRGLHHSLTSISKASTSVIAKPSLATPPEVIYDPMAINGLSTATWVNRPSESVTVPSERVLVTPLSQSINGNGSVVVITHMDEVSTDMDEDEDEVKPNYDDLIALAKKYNNRITASVPGQKLKAYKGMKAKEMRPIFLAMADAGYGTYDPQSGSFTL